MAHGYNPEGEVNYLESLGLEYRSDAAAWERVMFELEHIERNPVLAYELEFLSNGEIGKNGKSIIEMTNPHEAGGAYAIHSLSEITKSFQRDPNLKTAMYLSPDIGYNRDYLYVLENNGDGTISARAFEYNGDEKSRVLFHRSIVQSSGDNQERSTSYFQPIVSNQSISTKQLALLAEQSYLTHQQRQEYQEYRSRLAAEVIREQFIAAEQKQRVLEVKHHLEQVMNGAVSKEGRITNLYQEIYQWAAADQVVHASGLKRADIIQRIEYASEHRKPLPQHYSQEEASYYQQTNELDVNNYDRQEVPVPYVRTDMDNAGVYTKRKNEKVFEKRSVSDYRQIEYPFVSIRSEGMTQKRLNFLLLEQYITHPISDTLSKKASESSTNMFARFLNYIEDKTTIETRLKNITGTFPEEIQVSSNERNDMAFFNKKGQSLHSFEKLNELIHIPILREKVIHTIEQKQIITIDREIQLMYVLAALFDTNEMNNKEEVNIESILGTLTRAEQSLITAFISKEALVKKMQETMFFLGVMKQIQTIPELSGGMLILVSELFSEESLKAFFDEQHIQQSTDIASSYEGLIMIQRMLQFIRKQKEMHQQVVPYKQRIELRDVDTIHREQRLQEESLLELSYLLTFYALLEELRDVFKEHEEEEKTCKEPLLASIILYLAKIKEQGTQQSNQPVVFRKKQQSVSFAIPQYSIIYSFAA